MEGWNLFWGLVEVEITSAEPERALDAFSMANIDIRNIQQKNELSFSFVLPVCHYADFERLCKKYGDDYKVIGKQGVFWKVKTAISRPALMLGGLMLLVLMLWLPTRVLFIEVEGNNRVSSQRVLEAAENCGITFGASRRKIRSEKTKNALLQEVPQLQWVGVNTAGTTAVISVREKEAVPEQDPSSDPSDLCASIDGHILSCTATAGNLLIKPGDTVRKGQTLISAYTDCGICIRAERADGEVIAQTMRQMSVKMPSTVSKKATEQEKKRKYSLLIRKKRIFLWKDSGIWDTTCGRMYEEYYITLPGGFRLPVALCIDTYSLGNRIPADIPHQQAAVVLKRFCDAYLSQQMIAGTICSRSETVALSDGCYRLNGRYICEEMIGTIRQKQIGDKNGKNN